MNRPPRTVLVGGISSVHDELLAAALRRQGVPAEAIRVPDATALATGRRLLARGHCNPTYYFAGALVERLRAECNAGSSASQVEQRFAHLTLGSCGPCRFATYAAEYRRALSAAGFPGVPVVVIDQLQPRHKEDLAALGITLDSRLITSLVRAVVAGDLLVRSGCQTRPLAADPDHVDEVLRVARTELSDSLLRDRRVEPVLARMADRLDALPRSPLKKRVRVRVVGEFFAAHTDGDGGYRLVRWLESRGAIVEPPAVTEWLLYLAWQTQRDASLRVGLYAPDPGPRGLLGRDGARLIRRSRSAERSIARLHRRYARAARVPMPVLDMNDLATLARPHYHSDLRAGKGHLEVGSFLAADRDGSADLVVSIKPFGCLPSSAVSDGVLTVLARRARQTEFVAIETTGDAQAIVESRLELALDRARCALEKRTLESRSPVDKAALDSRESGRQTVSDAA